MHVQIPLAAHALWHLKQLSKQLETVIPTLPACASGFVHHSKFRQVAEPPVDIVVVYVMSNGGVAIAA